LRSPFLPGISVRLPEIGRNSAGIIEISIFEKFLPFTVFLVYFQIFRKMPISMIPAEFHPISGISAEIPGKNLKNPDHSGGIPAISNLFIINLKEKEEINGQILASYKFYSHFFVIFFSMLS
jgi:hypothetical protein